MAKDKDAKMPAGQAAQEDKAQQEQQRMMRLSMLEQEAKKLQQQLHLIEQQIVELQILKINLEEIEKAKPKDELLTSVGRNIFIKTSLISKELLVDIGAKSVVKKSISETQKLIDKDVDNLMQARNNLAKYLQQIGTEFQQAV